MNLALQNALQSIQQRLRTHETNVTNGTTPQPTQQVSNNYLSALAALQGERMAQVYGGTTAPAAAPLNGAAAASPASNLAWLQLVAGRANRHDMNSVDHGGLNDLESLMAQSNMSVRTGGTPQCSAADLKSAALQQQHHQQQLVGTLGRVSAAPPASPAVGQQGGRLSTAGSTPPAHADASAAPKQFLCEICGKAFRFRSNLAEHRSVHTALKPYVCKFCGKSSRLKGNLTKHILKHHKKEQSAAIGTDDIIIKKGKKSVKDPAAVDFLEKSMIVLTPGKVSTSSDRGMKSPHKTSPWQIANNSVNGPTNLGASENDQRNALSRTTLDAMLSARSSVSNVTSGNGAAELLMSSAATAALPHDQPQSQRGGNNIVANTGRGGQHLFDSLFAAAFGRAGGNGAHLPQPTVPLNLDTLLTAARHTAQEKSEQHKRPLPLHHIELKETLAEQHWSSSSGASPHHSHGNAESSGAACDAAAEKLPPLQKQHRHPLHARPHSVSHQLNNMKQESVNDDAECFGTGSTTSPHSAAGSPDTTRCHLCHKHFRKGNALSLHMTLKHGYPPPELQSNNDAQPQEPPIPSQANDTAAAECAKRRGGTPLDGHAQTAGLHAAAAAQHDGGSTPSPNETMGGTCSTPDSSPANSHNSSGGGLELGALLTSVAAQRGGHHKGHLGGHAHTTNVHRGGSPVNAGQSGDGARQLPDDGNGQPDRLEHTVDALEGRVGRLEKQMDTVLSTMYTMVRLQTGMSQSLAAFRDESHRFWAQYLGKRRQMQRDTSDHISPNDSKRAKLSPNTGHDDPQQSTVPPSDCNDLLASDGENEASSGATGSGTQSPHQHDHVDHVEQHHQLEQGERVGRGELRESPCLQAVGDV